MRTERNFGRSRASLARAQRNSQGPSHNLGTVSSTSSEGGIGDHPTGNRVRNSSKHCPTLMSERAWRLRSDKTTSRTRGPSDANWRHPCKGTGPNGYGEVLEQRVRLRRATARDAGSSGRSPLRSDGSSSPPQRRPRDSRARPARRRACAEPSRARGPFRRPRGCPRA